MNQWTGHGWSCQKAHLLLEHEDSHLELALNLGVLDLDTLQTVDSSSDRWGQGLDVAG